MKSNVCELSKDLSCLSDVLNEVEKVTAYNGLDEKSALRLRLLAEELCGMLPGLVEKFSGKFWAENNGSEYRLHVELKADNLNIDTREELIAISKSGKNEAAKGIMGKIRAIAESMILAASDPAIIPQTTEYYDCHGYNMCFGYTDPALASETGYMYSWSLYSYMSAIEEQKSEKADAYAELERSIVAKLADDITVGVRGKNVEIVVKKLF